MRSKKKNLMKCGEKVLCRKPRAEEKKPLGEGSYGQVMKGTHKDGSAGRPQAPGCWALHCPTVRAVEDTGAVRAIKAINRHKISDPARFQVEVDIQSSLDHPIL
eukprot:Skav212260  [mRNA]  locus=scaffold732:27826:28137:- [translate_table: standard]